MSGNVVKHTAKERTLEMWDNEVEVTQEEITLGRQRGQFDPDSILGKWLAEAQNDGPEGLICRVSLARYKNGRRGIQFVRFKDPKQPHFSSQLLLYPEEYYTLAQCIFRESLFIRELCRRFPEGTDPTVDGIRTFCQVDR